MSEEVELRPTRPAAPEVSNWGVFGDDDELGTLNFLTPQAVLRGVETVQTGDRYPLNLPLDVPSSPDGGSPAFKPDLPGYEKTTPRRNATRHGLVANDDHVAFATQGSSQWDALIHAGLEEEGVDGIFYNGVGKDAIDQDGLAERNGIDTFARVGIVGRGVLLDIARMAAGGAADPLPPDYVCTPEQTRNCVQHQQVEIAPGDIVCFRTGWSETFLDADSDDRHRMLTSEDGSGLPPIPGITSEHAELAQSQRWAAVTADNAGVESLPLRDPARSAHVRMMRNLGLPFGELLLFKGLAEACAADQRWEFLFVAVPLWIPGGMGSPSNAIAIR